MSEKGNICPATHCPYLGLAQGSPWTGEKDAECDTEDCGWYTPGYCIAGAEFAMPFIEKYGPENVREKPSCEFEGSCQWQAEAEGVCGPRKALMVGADPEEVRIND